MADWRYFYHGLSVHSEICLPEWSAFESSACLGNSEAEVAIRVEEPGTEIQPAEGEYRFFIEHAGSFIVRHKREILVIPVSPLPRTVANETDLGARKLRSFLLGSAWGSLMYQRGALVLHASAVVAGAGAVAFCARRGGGKSTLSASFSRLGYPLVSDDLCCIDLPQDAPPSVYPSVSRFRLREDVIVHLGWNIDSAHVYQPQSGKYNFRNNNGGVSRTIPLRRIYLLSWGSLKIRRLRGLDALARLTSAGTWRADLLMSAGDPAEHLSGYARLLRDVECWEFRRPRVLNQLSQSVMELAAHLSNI